MFCREYLVDLNATQAAVRAGYSRRTARSIGSENLTKPDIQEHIEHLMAERVARTEMTSDAVLHALEELAYSNIFDVLDVQPDDSLRVRDVRTLSKAVRRAIKTLKARQTSRSVNGARETITTIEVAMWDKLAALGMLARHHGLLSPERQGGAASDDTEREYTVTMVIPPASPIAHPV